MLKVDMNFHTEIVLICCKNKSFANLLFIRCILLVPHRNQSLTFWIAFNSFIVVQFFYLHSIKMWALKPTIQIENEIIQLSFGVQSFQRYSC